jgi:hypothetical protein
MLLGYQAQDPMMQEFLFRRSLIFMFDVPVYNYIFYAVCGGGILFGTVLRHFLFNPDVFVKRGELRKPIPDRVKQYGYAHPYYNSRMRNWAAKYRWTFIDNEPDYMDGSLKGDLTGLRPERKQSIRRLPAFYSVEKYKEQDPLYSSVKFASMEKLYSKESGYKGRAGVDGGEEAA